MTDQKKTNSDLFKDERFFVDEWTELHKHQIESLRMTMEVVYNREVDVQECLQRLVDWGYEKMIDDITRAKFI